ncbi:hypothetical protein DFH27DRAFT_230051 [Peziza echinospora]|nr:hypothetical protein DFH27DRAFT_230051 [Peziza echinospora]
MPPRSLLTAAASATTSSTLTTTLRPAAATTRLFTTSAPTSGVSPESPKYIEIPRPPRAPRLFTPHVKGKLPTPKAIFPSVGPDKTSPAYLSRLTKLPTTPRPIPSAAHKPEEAAYVAWKLKMADKRRQNLRQGLLELSAKKKAFDSHRQEIRERRTQARQDLLDKKEREDVRLTLPSVLSTLRASDRISDPNRAERLHAKAQQHAAAVAEKAGERREHIHDLYLHAETFILTEAQLEAAIEAEFRTESLYRTFPLTVSEMLAERNKGPSVSSLGSLNHRESELVLQTAGVLTGGRLPSGTMSKLAEASHESRYRE